MKHTNPKADDWSWGFDWLGVGSTHQVTHDPGEPNKRKRPLGFDVPRPKGAGVLFRKKRSVRKRN